VEPRRSNRWKKYLAFIVILIGTIIFIYAILQADSSSHTTPAKPKSTSQQASKNKSGSQTSTDKPTNKQTAPSSSSGSSNGAASQNLADSGPGDVAALFLLAATFGYIAHRFYLKRTL
jgi:cytoskeletal protein RodZ